MSTEDPDQPVIDQNGRLLGQSIHIQGLPTELQFYHDGPETESYELLYFLPLTLDPRPEEEVYLRGLALRKAGEPNVYQRVGCVEPSMRESDGIPKHDPIIELLGKLERKEDGAHTFSRDQSDAHKFRII